MFDASGLSSHPVDVGIRSEGAILGELSRRGYDVFSPFSCNHRYDFVIDMSDRFVKCKTGRLENGALLFAKVSTRCSRTAVHVRSYVGEIDIFLVYLPVRESIYVIPIADVEAGLRHLRIDPPANNQRRGIHWAEDYVLGSGERARAALPDPPRLTLASLPE